VHYARTRGWTRIALATSNDVTGLDGDQAVLATLGLPENRGVQLVAHEHFNPADLSVAAQVARINAAKPQAVLIWTTGAPFGTFLHGLSDGGVAVPVFTPNSNMTATAMKQFSAFLPPEVYFASVLGQSSGIIGRGPIRDAQTVYGNAMRAANVQPDVGHAIIWDSAMMVVDAYRRFGAAMTAAQLHDWIEGLHSWIGINGVYNFSSGDQHGMYGSTNEMLFRWDSNRQDFVGVSRPGGAPLR
jgi:branched-chain amino acid transport system substrate-binding protein